MKNEKTFITLEEYNAYRDRIFNDLPYDQKEWKTIAERDEMEKKLSEMYKNLMPEVGMGATEILWSDRRAKTVVDVVTPNKIIVRENEVKCVDYFKGDYEILEELSCMPQEIFTRRKSGRWVELGHPDKYGSVFLVLGHRAHYIDPNF
jgi:hypothetical protein